MSFLQDIPLLPYPHRLRASRARRRFYVVLNVLAILAMAVLMWVVTLPDPGLVRSGLQALAVLGLLGVLLLLNAQLGQATGTMVSYRHLDERQRAELHWATRIGHTVTSVFIFVTFVAVVTMGLPSVVSLPEKMFVPVLFLIYMVHASLPLLYLAWTQPNETPEEEDV